MTTNDEMPANWDQPKSYTDSKGSLWDLVKICEQVQSTKQAITWYDIIRDSLENKNEK
jgi:hypothetical protein